MASARILMIAALFLAAVEINCLPVLSHDNSMDAEILREDKCLRLPTHTMPVFYDIRLIASFKEDFFDGEVNILIDVREPTDSLTLHSKTAVYEDSLLKPENGGNVLVPERCSYDDTNEMLALHYNQKIPIGRYSLHFEFRGNFSDDLRGFYKLSYVDQDNQSWLAITHFEEIFARKAFPCWDEPAFKATFNISIKHHPNFTALSNMPAYEHSKVDEKDGLIWTRFEETPIMSTYLVAFAIFDFDYISNNDGTIKIWCRKSMTPLAKFPLEMLQKTLDELERYINSTVRVPKMDNMITPNLYSGGMENWGLITYREDRFIYNPKADLPYQKEAVATVAAHELAHQWFGNIVSPSWWTHFWLNEGFASYFQYYTVDKIEKDWRVMETFVPRVVHSAFHLDSADDAQALGLNVSCPAEIRKKFTYIVYQKTPAVLRMLSACLSEDVFRAGLIKYIERHQYNVASPENLWQAYQDALDESDVSKFNVAERMDGWINQQGYPLVTVTRNYESGDVTITQEYFREESIERASEEETNRNTEAINRKWWIPISFVTSSNLDFSAVSPSHWLSPQDESITISGVDPDDWIIVNVQQMGFYRVNYDQRNWERILEYLNSENHTNVHPINRAEIIDDSYMLMVSKRLNPLFYARLMNYLSRETDYVPWLSAFSVMLKLNRFFCHAEGMDAIKPYVWSLMDKVIDKVGFNDRPDDDHVSKIMRDELLNAACRNEHPLCLDFMARKIVEYAENPKIKTTGIFWDYVHQFGIQNTNTTTWNKLWQLYLTENQTNYVLEDLGNVQDPNIIESYLNMTIAEDLPINSKDVIYIYQGIFFWNTKLRHMAVDFIIDNWEKVSERLEEKELIAKIMWKFSDDHQLSKIEKFLDDNEMSMTNVTRIKDEYREMSQRYLPEISEWFKNRQLELHSDKKTRKTSMKQRYL